MKELIHDVIHTLSTWIPSLIPIVIGLLLMAGLGLIVHDLIKAGTKGFGWAVLILLFGVVLFMLRVAVSVFREIAGGASSSDWDA